MFCADDQRLARQQSPLLSQRRATSGRSNPATRNARKPPISPTIAFARGRRKMRNDREDWVRAWHRPICGPGAWLIADPVCQAGLAIQWLCSFNRLWVAVTNRHSDCAAARPLRMNRSMCRLYLIWPNTGSIVIFRWA